VGHGEAQTELLSNQAGTMMNLGSSFIAIGIIGSDLCKCRGCETETSPEPFADYSWSIQSVVLFKVPKHLNHQNKTL
jgi:hypothetical protein